MILSIERGISPQLCIINKYTLLNFMCQGNATASPYQWFSSNVYFVVYCVLT